VGIGAVACACERCEPCARHSIDVKQGQLSLPHSILRSDGISILLILVRYKIVLVERSNDASVPGEDRQDITSAELSSS